MNVDVIEPLRAGLALPAFAALALVMVVAKALRSRSGDAHRRGVVLLKPARRSFKPARVGRVPRHRSLTLAGVTVPPWDETKHFKLVGTTGTGKSTAIRALLDGALQRGDRAVVADPDGGYCARFFNRYRGDVLLSPFEPESVCWDPCGEIEARYDVEQLASALIPVSADAAANEWRGYARTLVAALLRRTCDACAAKDLRTCTSAELWRLIATAPADDVRRAVAGTPAQPFLEPENARMFGSIRAVAVSAAAALEYVQAQRAALFSVREWVRRGGHGVLFIPYKAAQIAALRGMIAAWMRLAIFESMSGREGHDQRLWFVVDELDALGPIDGLKDALARLRKFGGRCVLGFQSIAQVSGSYGNADAQTIVENCGNTLILRCSGGESGGTSQFASRLIGERELIRRQTSRGSDRDGGLSARGARRSKNVSQQHVTEWAVMASQIEQLPDLCGYWKSASAPAWHQVRLSPSRT